MNIAPGNIHEKSPFSSGMMFVAWDAAGFGAMVERIAPYGCKMDF